jgi:glycine/D-amino acid oxidase-like deaminating enzyme
VLELIRSSTQGSWKAVVVQTPLITMEERSRIPVGPPVNNPLPSYWHDPKSPLANVIEPMADASDLTQPYDYAIIGSGISGTMIAFNLLKSAPGPRVVMVEAREICSGATGRNGGHTKAASYRSYMQHAEELGKEEALKIARLEYANIVETHRMAEDMGIHCESQLCDTVDMIYDKATFELGKVAVQALRADALGDEKDVGKMADYGFLDDLDMVHEDFMTETTNANPTLAEEEKLVGAFKYLAGRIHAYRFTTGVLQECVKEGLQLCANTPVHAIRPCSHIHQDSETLWDVFTQYNTITARTVVIATNGYTPYLLSELQGAIVPMRGQITAQRPGRKTKLPCPLSMTYSFIYREGYEYMIPRSLSEGGQHIVIGGGLGRLPNAGAREVRVMHVIRVIPLTLFVEVSQRSHHTTC